MLNDIPYSSSEERIPKDILEEVCKCCEKLTVEELRCLGEHLCDKARHASRELEETTTMADFEKAKKEPEEDYEQE